MDEQAYVDRGKLRTLLQIHPDWSVRDYQQATKRSLSWVKKWKKRLSGTDNDEHALRGQSRAPHRPPARISDVVVNRILDIRDHPPQNLKRTPGPKAILYYLHQDKQFAAQERLPHSTRTVWQILRKYGRIPHPVRNVHEPVERPAPMSSWQVDFKDISTVPAEADGKQQHVVETLNVVDVGTSILVDCRVREDFTAETVLEVMADIVRQHGLPKMVTFDRDTRFIGSWSAQEFPSPFMRFWQTLGVQVNVCPPRRPDKNAFVERYHRTYNSECLQIHRPTDVFTTRQVTETFMHHYNVERPNQALSCGNKPPRTVFPDLPPLPSTPHQVDPTSWLQPLHLRPFARRVRPNGTIQLDNHVYYVKQALAGQTVIVKVDASTRELLISHHFTLLKRVPLQGLMTLPISFDDFVILSQNQARDLLPKS
jgi:transposase InsO family protein